MPISKNRKKEISDCVEESVSKIRKETELQFNKDNYHKSGRSGEHGKKFNRISTVISHPSKSQFQ
ncbi:MAG: hypothetical protein RIQ33_1121 [Bacteroidota bacterium]|jgi:hypothetical protein